MNNRAYDIEADEKWYILKNMQPFLYNSPAAGNRLLNNNFHRLLYYKRLLPIEAAVLLFHKKNKMLRENLFGFGRKIDGCTIRRGYAKEEGYLREEKMLYLYGALFRSFAVYGMDK